MFFTLVFIITFSLTVFLTPLVRRWAIYWGTVDKPDGSRKIHTTPTPLLGGVAIFLSLVMVSLVVASTSPLLVGKDISWLRLIGLLIGGAVLMIGGWLDDRYSLLPKWQIFFPILASIIVILSGSTIQAVTNPVGGIIYIPTVWSGLITFVWLMGIMYTTKLLDGLDGLVAGLGTIGALIIFGLTQFTQFYQPSVGLLALILAGSSLGFLIWNWHPAKIFLGEGGSLLIGFVLGVLAIISGAKLATTLLVVGLPALDVLWVIFKRWRANKYSITHGDRLHTHYRLLDAGLNHRQAVGIIWAVAAGFGVSSLVLQSRGKIVALIVLIILTAIGMAGLYKISK